MGDSLGEFYGKTRGFLYEFGTWLAICGRCRSRPCNSQPNLVLAMRCPPTWLILAEFWFTMAAMAFALYGEKSQPLLGRLKPIRGQAKAGPKSRSRRGDLEIGMRSGSLMSLKVPLVDEKRGV